MRRHVADVLRDHGVQPSAQRVAVAAFVLDTDRHPSADQVFAAVRARFPMISRATVYNTLHVLVRKGLLREVILTAGRTAFDPNVRPHHHLVDDETGRISDLPWDALEVRHLELLKGVEVREYEVVVRGRRKRTPARRRRGP